MTPVQFVVVLACAVACSTGLRRAESQQTVGRPLIPAYTMDLVNIDNAINEVKSHVKKNDVYPPNGVNVNYLMIIHALNQLIENNSTADIIGKPDYYDIVDKAIRESFENPQQAADQVRAQIYKSVSKFESLKDLIVEKQNAGECLVPVSYQCDLIISMAIELSGDDLLQQQAHYFTLLAKEADLFLDSYAAEFESVADAKDAQAYLINGIDRLRAIIETGAVAREEGKVIPPISSRRFGGSRVQYYG